MAEKWSKSDIDDGRIVVYDGKTLRTVEFYGQIVEDNGPIVEQ